MIKYKIGTEFLDNYAGKSVNSAFAISKSISKIGEIGSRHGDRSTSFKVPLTAKNIRLLNYSTELNNANLEGTKKLNGQVIEDDQIIAIGYFQVVKFNPYKREVDLRFYSGNSDWFPLLRERKLNQDYNGYNATEILSILINSEQFASNLSHELPTSITDQGQTYYKYFLTDNGKNPTRNYTPDGGENILNTSFEDYQVGFSQGYLFEKIFNGLGVRLEGNLFSNPDFYRTLICNPINLEEAKTQDVNIAYKMLDSYSVSIPTTTLNPGEYTPILFQLPETDSEIFTGSGFTLKNGYFLNGFIFSVSIQCQALLGQIISDDKNVYLRVRKIDSVGVETVLIDNRLPDDKSTYDISGVQQTDREIGSFLFDVDELENEPLTGGDSIVIDYYTDISPSSSVPPVAKNWLTSGDILEEPYIDITLKDYYTTTGRSILLPDMTQSEFVKDALVQFGAVSQYDVATKTLTCNTFDIIESNKSKAKDYSNKLDLSIDPQVDITKQVQNYGKRSLFRYEDNEKEDFLSNLYKKITGYKLGDGVINIENDFLDEDKDVYVSPFAPTISTATFPRQNVSGGNNQLGNLYLPFIPVFEFEDIDGGASALSDLAKYKVTELKPRKLLFVDNVDLVDGSNRAMKGNVNSITLNDPVKLPFTYSTFALVYFDKDDYPEFETSTLNQYNKSLSFGRLNQLTDKTYGYGSTLKTKDTIIDKYYNLQTRVLNKPITLEAYFRLTSIDIANYDGFTPIWLSFGLDSGYYYINEIEQYQGQDKSTKLTLIKI